MGIFLSFLFKPEISEEKENLEGEFLERIITTESFGVWTAKNEEAEQGAKFSTFKEIREFLSDYEVPRGRGGIPPLL